MKYLREFNNHSQYETFTGTSEFILPNVSICTTEGDVHYNPYVEPVETRVVAKFNVTDTSNPTQIAGIVGWPEELTTAFTAIEIDGVAQPSVVSAYTFNTTGEHTVKYTLADPTAISESAFNSCNNLTSIDIPNSVTSIGNSAVYYCSGLTSVTIPSGVTSIGSSAFVGSPSLTSITVDDNNTVYDSRNNCNAIIETARNALVLGCKNTVIPNTVTIIEGWAFQNCTGLTSIEIPSGVTSIDRYAFDKCSSLTSITCNAVTAPTINKNTFQDVKTGGTLYVPIGSSGYNTWMYYREFYLGKSGWTKVEQ